MPAAQSAYSHAHRAFTRSVSLAWPRASPFEVLPNVQKIARQVNDSQTTLNRCSKGAR